MMETSEMRIFCHKLLVTDREVKKDDCFGLK